MDSLDTDDLIRRINADPELRLSLREFTGILRLQLGEHFVHLRVAASTARLVDPTGDVRISVTVPQQIWDGMTSAAPPPGTESLTAAVALGAAVDGEWHGSVAPYWGALARIVRLAADSVTGRVEVPVETDPFVDSDDPVGRYVRYAVDGLPYRVYYEQSGHGPTPVLFLHTAGADGRQYRHVLADPELQKRYRLIAVDLPYHGKSLPPIGSRWWEQKLVFSKEQLMDWIVGFIAAAEIDRPIFVGCSVGGQLASDLCAHHPDAIRGAIGLNGLYNMDAWAEAPNERYRDPRISSAAVSSIMYDVTGIRAPEAFRRELAWIYASNHRDAYPADNDYFMFGHDLRINGHLIDTQKTPLTILTGEYDLSVYVPDQGGAAVAEHIPGATFHVMTGQSHFAPSDDPHGFRPWLTTALDAMADTTSIQGVTR